MLAATGPPPTVMRALSTAEEKSNPGDDFFFKQRVNCSSLQEEGDTENAERSNKNLHSSSFKSYPNSTSPFAYAFVIGGCDPARKPSYQNYLFNILIAAKIFKEQGSKADVVAMFQVSSQATSTQLPEADLRLLHAAGVYIYYIPQQTTGAESFYRTQMDKFRILGLTQYQRVLFMDGDVMPLANLDFLFELSMEGKLQENVVLQGMYEPFNGGFFMLKPSMENLQQIQEIVIWREHTAKELPYPYFDVQLGWGHALSESDPWTTTKKDNLGINYTFHAAFADQGLLFHFTKFARQSVSVLMGNGNVENYAPVKTTLENGTAITTVQLVETLTNPFAKLPAMANRIHVKGKHTRGSPPRNLMIHFTGSSKPWLKRPEEHTNAAALYPRARHGGPHYWFWKLMQLDQELCMDLDFQTHWNSDKKRRQRPPLGMYPIYGHVLTAETNLLTPLQRIYPKSSVPSAEIM